jgi:hypothetical protein
MTKDFLAPEIGAYGSTWDASQSNDDRAEHSNSSYDSSSSNNSSSTSSEYSGEKINHKLPPNQNQLTLSTIQSSSDISSNITEHYNCDCEDDDYGNIILLNTYSYETKNINNQNNHKLVLSFIIWIICYLTMGTVGGTLAFMHFPRTESNITTPLPDFGYDVIPYFCPTIHLGKSTNMNVQDCALMFLYWSILAGCTFKYFCLYRNNQYDHNYKNKQYVFMEQNEQNNDQNIHELQPDSNHESYHFNDNTNTSLNDNNDPEILRPELMTRQIMEVNVSSNHNKKSPSKSKTSHPRLILQQLLHLDAILFLTRTSVVFVTGLPQPNPKCVAVQHEVVTYQQAFAFVMLRGFPPHACGDLIYSGHVGCILICMIVLTRHSFLKRTLVQCSMWFVAITGILSTITCRSHYTIDVILAFYFSFGIQEFYFIRSNGLIDGGSIGSLIRWLEAE